MLNGNTWSWSWLSPAPRVGWWCLAVTYLFLRAADGNVLLQSKQQHALTPSPPSPSTNLRVWRVVLMELVIITFCQPPRVVSDFDAAP